MPKKHLSIRIEDNQRLALEAMADDRNLDLSTMVRHVFDAALAVRQQACNRTHQYDQRCGACGLLLTPTGHALERL